MLPNVRYSCFIGDALYVPSSKVLTIDAAHRDGRLL